MSDIISQGSSLSRQGIRFTKLQETESNEIINQKPSYGQIWTAISLVSGTAVGAGILAVASVSLKPGFIPFSITLISAWLVMAAVGFLTAEVTCNIAAQDKQSTDFGIISVTQRLFGTNWARSIGLIFVVFHYTLLIAYNAEAGKIITQVIHIPVFLGPILFTVVFGGIIALSSTEIVNIVNNILFIMVVISFLGLICMGVSGIHTKNLGYQNYTEVPSTVPILLIALVFHNVIPTICSNLNYHRNSICTAITIGSLLPLIMFLLWNMVILGMITDYHNNANSNTLIDPVKILLNTDNNSSSNRDFGKALVVIFSEAAITTSFIGFVISLMEYYTDILPNRSKKDIYLYILILIPPMLIALGNPNIFLYALDIAGAYGISVLFGLLPVALVLRLR